MPTMIDFVEVFHGNVLITYALMTLEKKLWMKSDCGLDLENIKIPIKDP